MKRQHFGVAAFALLALTLAGAAAAIASPQPPQQAQQQDPGENGRVDPAKLITGQWLATVGGHEYILDLRLNKDGDLVGTVTLPDKKTVEIENGIFVVDEFSFATTESDVEWEWSGTLSESGLQGERERFDPDTHESFTAKRKP